jgi:hypothetical protein
VRKPDLLRVALVVSLLLGAAVLYSADLVDANLYPQNFKVTIESPTNGTTLSTTTVTLNVKTTVKTDFYVSDKTLSYSLDGGPDVAFTNLEGDDGGALGIRTASAEIGDLTSGPHTITVHAQNRYSSTNDNPYGFTLLAEAACSFVVDTPDARTPTPPPFIVIPAVMQTMLIMLLVAAFAVGCVVVYLQKQRRRVDTAL